MMRVLSIIALAVPPKVLSIGIIAFSLIAILIMVLVRLSSKKIVEPLREFDLSSPSTQRKKVRAEHKKKYTQKCFDETIRLLKLATIKKTYENTGFLAIREGHRTIYTIPLNRKEAVMYIWGKVIALTPLKDRDRVIRMAAVILSVLEENKNKHILELEAQAVAAAKIYGHSMGETDLQIRAVDNVHNVPQTRPAFSFFWGEQKEIAEKTEFLWPRSVASSVKTLRSFSLLAIANEDLISYTFFPCSSCKSDCSIFDLEDLKCPNCRKK